MFRQFDALTKENKLPPCDSGGCPEGERKIMGEATGGAGQEGLKPGSWNITKQRNERAWSDELYPCPVMGQSGLAVGEV